MNQHRETLNTEGASRRNSLIAGIAIIALGLIALAGQLNAIRLDASLVLPALAAIFLAWGLLTRTFGLIIPGGILAGIALGAYLTEGPFAGAGELALGGIFLVAFSLGWALIAFLSLFTARSFQWWPLVPAAILASVGALLLAGGSGLIALRVIGFLWPVVLIGVGAWVLIRRK